MLFGKYHFIRRNNYILSLSPIIRSNVIILALISVLMVAFQKYNYPRSLLFGTYILSFFIEIFVAIFFFYSKKLVADADRYEELNEMLKGNVATHSAPDKEIESYNVLTENIDIEESLDTLLALTLSEEKLRAIEEQNKKLIIQAAGEHIYNFMARFINFRSLRTLIFSTTSAFNIEKQPFNNYLSILNLHKINDFRRINKFFETVNLKMAKGGIFIGCVETKNLRKKRIMKSLPPIIRSIVYFFDFIYKRVFPKVIFTKKLYFFISKGRNRVISEQETFGRLYSCGFKLEDAYYGQNLMYFVARKKNNPVYDFDPSYGPLFRMRRIGKNGKIIYVYKFRTMYPFSEYLQEYMYDKFSLEEGGKFRDDYRITTIGRIMRKFWLDELPMFVNMFRGDLKLVGVRPLSIHYFSIYPEDMQKRRIKYKPGLIPPYYADLPKSFEDIVASEAKYLDKYDKHPFITDFVYFFKAVFNIIFRRARSK